MKRFFRIILFALAASMLFGGTAGAVLADGETYDSINILGYYAGFTLIGATPGWGNIPEKVSDGNNQTYCQPANNVQFTIRVNLKGKVLISKVAVEFFTVNFKKFTLKYSKDGENYTNLAPEVSVAVEIVEEEEVRVKRYEFEFPDGVDIWYLDFSISELDSNSLFGVAVAEIEMYNHSSFNPMDIPKDSIDESSDVHMNPDFDLGEYTATNPSRDNQPPDFSLRPDMGGYTGGTAYDDELKIHYLVLVIVFGVTAIGLITAGTLLFIRKTKNRSENNE